MLCLATNQDRGRVESIMRISIAVADYSVTRLSIFMGREGVFDQVSSDVANSAASVGLFENSNLEWIQVTINLNRFGENKKRVPTYCGKTSEWRYRATQSEYLAVLDFDLSPWDERRRKQQGLKALPTIEEVLPAFRSCFSAVIARVAHELHEPEECIAKFIEREGIQRPSVNAANDLESRAPDDVRYKVALEISFPEADFTPESGFALRADIRDVIESTLEQGNLGQFEGSSSGGGTFDLGFVVRDGEVVEVIKRALSEAGYDVNSFRFDIQAA